MPELGRFTLFYPAKTLTVALRFVNMLSIKTESLYHPDTRKVLYMSREKFLKSLCASLFNAGFNPYDKNRGAEISGATEHISGWKIAGSLMYVFFIYNSDVLGARVCAELYLRQVEHCESLIKNNGLRSCICLNFFVSENASPEIGSIIDASEDFFGQDIYNLNYGVVLSEKACSFSPKQPQDIFPAREMIAACFAESPAEEAGPPASAFEIFSKAREKTALPVKNNNPAAFLALILINAAVFALLEFNGGSENVDTLLAFGAMNYNLFMLGEFWRLFSAMFLHIGLTHLIFNCSSLLIFGHRAEKYFGTLQFIIIYIVSGMVGNLVNSWTSAVWQGQNTVLAGASGAIYGVFGAMFALLLITRKHMDGLSAYLMLIWIVIGTAMGFTMENIGNAAHIGGCVTGFIVGALFAAADGAAEG